MSVYYCDDSGFVKRVKILVIGVLIYERYAGFVETGKFPYSPMFWYLFSSRPSMSVYYCDNIGWVERLPGYEGITTL